jgi:hypothetical protein
LGERIVSAWPSKIRGIRIHSNVLQQSSITSLQIVTIYSMKSWKRKVQRLQIQRSDKKTDMLIVLL